MKTFFKQSASTALPIGEDLAPVSLKEAIEKTRQALEIAYSGFDNATDVDLIDSYIYEINALQKRYRHLTELAAVECEVRTAPSRSHSPIRTLVGHVFG